MSIAIESKDMEEKIYNLFPTPLHYKNVGTDLVNQKMIDDTRKVFHKSMEYSNVGGYQSSPNLKGPAWQPLFMVAKAQLIEYLKTLGAVAGEWNIQGAGLWLNVNGRGHYNKPHNHGGTHFSGIYYVKVPPKSGMLYFQRPSMHNPIIEEHGKLADYGPLIEIMPREGDMFIFPSELNHGVYPNFSREERISIAFNLNILGYQY